MGHADCWLSTPQDLESPGCQERRLTATFISYSWTHRRACSSFCVHMCLCGSMWACVYKYAHVVDGKDKFWVPSSITPPYPLRQGLLKNLELGDLASKCRRFSCSQHSSTWIIEVYSNIPAFLHGSQNLMLREQAPYLLSHLPVCLFLF